jgi:B9 domain-containing protein 2
MRRAPTSWEQAAKAEDNRSPPQRPPEVHLIGEIKYGAGFGHGVSCKFRIDHGKHWGVLEGSPDGHTQTAYGPEDMAAVWNHPFDVHYQTASMQGWPRVMVQVQHLDSYGRVSIIAHGFAHLPCTPGCHETVIPCWRATGTQEEELRGRFASLSVCLPCCAHASRGCALAHFLGEYPVLLDEDLVYHKAPAYRHRLVTVPSGKVTDLCPSHLDVGRSWPSTLPPRR